MITFAIVTIIITSGIISEQDFDSITCNYVQFAHAFYNID